MVRINTYDGIATGLVIAGGINWGVVGALNIDIIASLLGSMSILSRTVYVLVGIATLWSIWRLLQ